MKKALEMLKDFLYDSIDYLIMIGIVGVVVFIIGWRLDLLFESNAQDNIPRDNIVVEGESDFNDSSDIKYEDSDQGAEDEDALEAKDDTDSPQDGTGAEDKIEDQEVDKKPIKEPAQEDSGNVTIDISIPAGSSSSEIAYILKLNGLISDRAGFVNKTEEMQLSSKLKAGDFKIESNSSLETILRVLTK